MKLEDIDIDAKTKEIMTKALGISEADDIALEDLWRLVDKIWDEYGCDNRNLDWGKINRFYSHPVWMLNGLFTENDAVSVQHRKSIAEWIAVKGFSRILDYGGGFGKLARLIAEIDKSVEIEIFEPHPSSLALSLSADYPNVRYVDFVGKDYDCIVSYSVLEHMPEPLQTFREIAESAKYGGYLLFANDFSPVVKCHLPSTFHLRYSFNIIAQLIGLQLIGPCTGSPAIIFRKSKALSFELIGIYNLVSRTSFPFLEILRFCYIFLKRYFFKGA